MEEETGQVPMPELRGTPPASAPEQVSSPQVEVGEVTEKYPLPELVVTSSPASATEQVASSPVEVAEWIKIMLFFIYLLKFVFLLIKD